MENYMNDNIYKTGDNLRFSKLYDKISPFYYIGQIIFSRIKFGGEYNFRNDNEMIRISKPGKEIFIIDETEKTVKKSTLVVVRQMVRI
jgi:hypothetical protein